MKPLDENMVSNVLEFKRVKVRDCMIPRTEITAVEAGETIERLQHAFLESGFFQDHHLPENHRRHYRVLSFVVIVQEALQYPGNHHPHHHGAGNDTCQ